MNLTSLTSSSVYVPQTASNAVIIVLIRTSYHLSVFNCRSSYFAKHVTQSFVPFVREAPTNRELREIIPGIPQPIPGVRIPGTTAQLTKLPCPTPQITPSYPSQLPSSECPKFSSTKPTNVRQNWMKPRRLSMLKSIGWIIMPIRRLKMSMQDFKLPWTQ